MLFHPHQKKKKKHVANAFIKIFSLYQFQLSVIGKENITRSLPNY